MQLSRTFVLRKKIIFCSPCSSFQHRKKSGKCKLREQKRDIFNYQLKKKKREPQENKLRRKKKNELKTEQTSGRGGKSLKIYAPNLKRSTQKMRNCKKTGRKKELIVFSLCTMCPSSSLWTHGQHICFCYYTIGFGENIGKTVSVCALGGGKGRRGWRNTDKAASPTMSSTFMSLKFSSHGQGTSLRPNSSLRFLSPPLNNDDITLRVSQTHQQNYPLLCFSSEQLFSTTLILKIRLEIWMRFKISKYLWCAERTKSAEKESVEFANSFV